VNKYCEGKMKKYRKRVENKFWKLKVKKAEINNNARISRTSCIMDQQEKNNNVLRFIVFLPETRWSNRRPVAA